MGKGNYLLVGYYMCDEFMLFGFIMKVKKGDKIYLIDFENLYEYIVMEIKMIDEIEVSVIDDMKDVRIIFIICDKLIEIIKWFVVVGELEKMEKLIKELENKYFFSK